ncbi:HTH-type transcriptional regulator BenM [compost metagenome]
MEFRHLRYFVAVAEELHFARAAERLHIEQSPLSRAIKELESDLGVLLLERTTRTTRLTWAGQVFLDDVRHLFLVLEQAKANVHAAASGYRGTLRVALSDGIIPHRLTTLLARCREEEPDVDIRLSEVPLTQQLKGLRNRLYDVGFARSSTVGEGILAKPLWEDPLMIALPSRHPLLARKHLQLDEVLKYPLVLYHPEICEGFYSQITRILRTASVQPVVAEHVASHDLMLALVAAGYGIGFVCKAQITACQRPGIAARPLTRQIPRLTTYLLRPAGKASPELERFMERANLVQDPD